MRKLLKRVAMAPVRLVVAVLWFVVVAVPVTLFRWVCKLLRLVLNSATASLSLLLKAILGGLTLIVPLLIVVAILFLLFYFVSTALDGFW